MEMVYYDKPVFGTRFLNEEKTFYVYKQTDSNSRLYKYIYIYIYTTIYIDCYIYMADTI